ncbi:hypothetical protein CPB85DRAFT_403522 [Mucidula mucida]|nr:hypothetical protein CPB85DRAFT_403522 [Mucidula mucida]
MHKHKESGEALSFVLPFTKMSDNLNTPQLVDEPGVVIAEPCDQSSKSGFWTITNVLMILLLVLSITGIVLRVITPRRMWPPNIIQGVLLRCAVVDAEIRSVASTRATSGIIIRVLKTLHSGVLPFVRSWKKRYAQACALEAEMDDIEAIPEVSSV